MWGLLSSNSHNNIFFFPFDAAVGTLCSVMSAIGGRNIRRRRKTWSIPLTSDLSLATSIAEAIRLYAPWSSVTSPWYVYKHCIGLCCWFTTTWSLNVVYSSQLGHWVMLHCHGAYTYDPEGGDRRYATRAKTTYWTQRMSPPEYYICIRLDTQIH